MLTIKEIADYVHGPAKLLEKQQFSFGELKKIGQALSGHLQPLAVVTDAEPRLTTMTTLTAVSSEAKEERSRQRTGGVIEMHGTTRNIFLILLFVVIFAVMFVLNSRQAPANPVHTHPWSTSSLGLSM